MEEVRSFDSKCCKEIYVIFNKLELFYKLPEELRKYIYINQDLLYNYDFNINLPLIYQVKSDKTKACISYLYLKYINSNLEEKDILLKKYQQNEKIYQEKLREKYNPDHIFKNKKSQEEINTEIVALVQKKEFIFRKLFNKIKSVFSSGRK